MLKFPLWENRCCQILWLLAGERHYFFFFNQRHYEDDCLAQPNRALTWIDQSRAGALPGFFTGRVNLCNTQGFFPDCHIIIHAAFV